MNPATKFINDLTYLAIGLLIILVFSLAANFIFFVRENEFPLAINCNWAEISFSSYGDLLSFISKNPQYSKRLDPNHKNGYCETVYGKH